MTWSLAIPGVEEDYVPLLRAGSGYVGRGAQQHAAGRVEEDYVPL